LLLVSLFWIAFSFSTHAQQPILPDFHADPSARVFNGKLYIYPSHDAPGARNWKGMVDWHVFSTDDMVKWTDHGVAFGLKDISWADTEAWAPDCIERNGKYYFYFPAGGQIGVAVSDSPTGPFKDAIGHPLVKKGEAGIRYMIDPHIFIDDNGQAYLYVGGGRQLGVVKLKRDMITPDGPIQILEMPKFYEGVWIHKYNGNYYASYPIRPPGHDANVMVYSMAKNPLGLWEYKGEILDNHSHNVHCSITQFKGQWYLFYHVEGPSRWERRVCVEPLFYYPDGTIKPIQISKGKIGNCLVTVTEFGAKGDGETLNTESIQAAIDKCAASGGGTVVVPKGVFVSGAIFLKPGVNLHLEKDAVLKGTTDMKNYPEMRIRIEGHFEEKYSSGLINAEGCNGLQITGEGTLDGNGRPIWDLFWKLRKQADDYKNFRNLSIPRAQLCIINNSDNVVIDGVVFKDSQYWNLHLYNCRNVTVQNARFQVPDDYKQAPSTDGIDVDSCQDVEINKCYFSVTDDCIAMKGTWGPFALEDKKSMPVERVHISDCTFRRGGAAITCGSDASSARDILVEDCEIKGFMPLLCLKLRRDTPQCYENITLRNINLDSGGISIFSVQPWEQYINMQGQSEPTSYIRNITVSGIGGSINYLGVIKGNEKTIFGSITLKDVDVKAKRSRFEVSDKVENLTLDNVRVNGENLSFVDGVGA